MIYRYALPPDIASCGNSTSRDCPPHPIVVRSFRAPPGAHHQSSIRASDLHVTGHHWTATEISPVSWIACAPTYGNFREDNEYP